ncbi:cytochrome P450 [Actinomadura sp. WMMB 499]|uniref:cytochrome P450 n=1 Tax=Actinomadura sp. WMMB 499 TaxID=1219491 RepID=UPI0012493250|nr:cytochrome P450 [Actinomadura sp. WMMB 499]QFG25817.1 cytochrome P450 [Actinomadura sp. WMMB 499]
MERSAVPFPVHRDDPLDPPAEYAALLDGPPVRVRMPDGSEPWMVSRLADVRAVLADPRLSADDQLPNFPHVLPLPPVPGALSFLRMDDPEHARLRRTLTAEFTVRRVNLMRPGITETVDALLDAMVGQGPPADLVSEFALPLPSLVICRLLGVPYRDHDFFQDRSAESLRTDITQEEAGAAFGELAAYLDGLVAEKEREPTDDLLGRVARRVRAGDLEHAEAVAMARLLLLAGHETTANMIALGTFTLLRHPDELDRLRADPALIRPAMEELLRYLTIVHRGTQRVTLEPVEVGGVTIGAGEGVIVALAAADRDPGAFADPGVFDPARPPGHHVAFGFGAHQCIGQTLARLEMEIAFARMLDRLPGLALACAPGEVRFRDSVVYGVRELPVTW